MNKPGVAPRKHVERVRLYEFLVKLIGDECTSRKYHTRVCNDIIKNLETILNKNDYTTNNTNIDELEQCIIGLQEETRNEVSSVDSTETTTDQYQDIEQDEDGENINNSCGSDTHKLPLCDVISAGKEKVIEMNIPKMRENKQRRKKRFKSFLDKIYEKVNTREEKTTKELTTVNSEMSLAHNAPFRT